MIKAIGEKEAVALGMDSGGLASALFRLKSR